MIATEADLPRIVDIGRRAHEASAFKALASFNAEDFAASCRHLMADDTALVLVSPTASLWIKRFPLYFNHAETVANEVFYGGLDYGSFLRREGEAWAAGCLITMSRNAATRTALDSIYRRAGYAPIEHTWIRRL